MIFCACLCTLEISCLGQFLDFAVPFSFSEDFPILPHCHLVMCFTVEKSGWFLFPPLVPCFFSSWADWLLTGFCLCPSSSLPLPGCISVLIAVYQFFLRLSGHLILQFQVLLYCMNLFRMGFPGGSDFRVHLRCRRPEFDPWVGRISWRRARQPTLVFLPGESHGQRSLVGYTHGIPESWTRLSN